MFLKSKPKKKISFNNSGSNANIKFSRREVLPRQIAGLIFGLTKYCCIRARRINAASIYRCYNWLNTKTKWQRCRWRNSDLCHLSPVTCIETPVQQKDQVTDTQTFPQIAGETVSCWVFLHSDSCTAHFFSFVPLCRFLFPWKHSYMLTLAVIKDHKTKEMFCFLTRCFVFLCLKMLPILTTTKELINISPDGLLSLLSYFKFLLFL